MAQVGEPRAVDTLPEDSLGPSSEAIVGLTPKQLFWRRFRKDRWSIAGGCFVIVIAFLALLAPVAAKVTGHPPDAVYVYDACDEFGLPVPPGPGSETSGRHDVGNFLFGGSSECGDLFVQILYGARTSLVIAGVATVIELGIGIVFGLLAGFYRGRTDTALSRLGDVFLALPIFLLSLGLVSACGLSKDGCLGGLLKPGMALVAFVIGFFSWPYIMRVVRGQVLVLREREFVESARAIGASNRWIMFREILPSLGGILIVYATLTMPINILFEAALSFLGIGLPPDVPSWGKMLEEASGRFVDAPWLMLFPGIFIVVLTLGFNLLGDGLRDALDVKTD